MPDSVIKSEAPAADYDGFAAAYSARNENSLFNAYYERPEMIRLAGDVAGLDVLDAGCGSGPLAEALRAKDAVVASFDLSPAMVELARERLGEDADGRDVDLGAPLPYPDNKFDLVVASLALHYVVDWASAGVDPLSHTPWCCGPRLGRSARVGRRRCLHALPVVVRRAPHPSRARAGRTYRVPLLHPGRAHDHRAVGCVPGHLNCDVGATPRAHHGLAVTSESGDSVDRARGVA